MKIKNTLPISIALALAVNSPWIFPDENPDTMDRGEIITVSADFVEQPQNRYPGSVTLFSDEEIQQLSVQHFEELINWVPNLNFAGGTSRPRYFQIRGIGERSQYQGAPNPSVGVIIDDIDFSGIGGIATTFDVAQIDVLKGPQGARYGANALAGLIYIQTADPSEEFSASSQLTLAQDNTWSVGVAAGGALNDSVNYRFALQQFNNDGFRKNVFLNRSDTNEKDEFNSRLKLTWQASENLSVKTTLMHVNLNNGYDAWAPDNGFTTYTDKPGRDEQKTNGASVKAIWSGNANYTLTSITSHADSDILFSFDGDWGNPVFWGVNGPYDFTSDTDRHRETNSQELRWSSTDSGRIFSDHADWIGGLYYLNLKEKNNNLDLFDGSIYNQLQSRYRANSSALFGEINYHFNDKTSLRYGLRLEHRNAQYRDSNLEDLSPSQTMLGGHISLEHLYNDDLFTYATLSKGYKAGGFNIGTNIPADRKEFGTENLYNFEVGAKAAFLDDQLLSSLSFFFMKRSNQQVETSFQDDPTDPLSFTFFTDNAAKGTNMGAEFSLQYAFLENWRLLTNIGLLDTRFDKYQVGTRDLNGRQQAHAPHYTYATALKYQDAEGFFGLLEISGKDKFFFSNSHDQKSKRYNLVNLKLGYEQNKWRLYLWGRNLFDKEYAVRGFFFANEPPLWIDKRYIRLGDPRQLGLTFNYDF